MAKLRQRPWHGVRTRRVHASPDPDAAPRWVEMPALWDDDAAAALAALAPGLRATGLREAAEPWLSRLPPDLAEAACGWLLARRAAPDEAAWAGVSGAYALNLAAFDEPGFGLDGTALRQAASGAAAASRALGSAAPALRLTDLDGLLAASGLDYASQAGRDMAVSVVGMVREAADGARLLGTPGLVDALLGAEAGGIAPRFDWLDEAGRLSRGALALLAARGLSAETALAAALAGRSPLRLADSQAHAAMRDALAPFMTLAELIAPQTATGRREPPSRPGGFAKRVTLGGHKVFVRTAEFSDGTVGELSLGLPKESAAVRALVDSLGQVASLALQHGTPLVELVELLAGTRFGPAGAVDGDPDVARASSPLDYLARTLAAAYLPQLTLDAVEEETAAPVLPLDLPKQSRPRLHVVR